MDFVPVAIHLNVADQFELHTAFIIALYVRNFISLRERMLKQSAEQGFNVFISQGKVIFHHREFYNRGAFS